MDMKRLVLRGIVESLAMMGNECDEPVAIATITPSCTCPVVHAHSVLEKSNVRGTPELGDVGWR
eukprot:scaffold633_cov288-Ochromonas_danica.AAC.49